MTAYLCRDCLGVFTGPPLLHPGDQYCQLCQQATAEQIAISCVRQLNLEALGFTTAEIDADIGEWQAAR